MTHLFLWRDVDICRNSTTYAITRVNMDDRPSSAIAQIALQEIAIMYHEKLLKARLSSQIAIWMIYLRVLKQ